MSQPIASAEYPVFGGGEVFKLQQFEHLSTPSSHDSTAGSSQADRKRKRSSGIGNSFGMMYRTPETASADSDGSPFKDERRRGRGGKKLCRAQTGYTSPETDDEGVLNNQDMYFVSNRTGSAGAAVFRRRLTGGEAHELDPRIQRATRRLNFDGGAQGQQQVAEGAFDLTNQAGPPGDQDGALAAMIEQFGSVSLDEMNPNEMDTDEEQRQESGSEHGSAISVDSGVAWI